MITFSSVTKKFGSGNVALDNVSFHLEPGDFAIISGPSGSGKTTIMKLLIKDLLPTKGEISYKDFDLKDIKGSKLPEHRRKIGVVFQDYKLLPELNVWENIALPLSIMGKPVSEIESRVTDLLNLVSLTDKALMFPKQLSGGEAQRVSIARALATGPGLIFADEPTGNLDKDSSLSIIKLLKQINELGTTVLLATHDVVVLDELSKERLIKLDKGSLKSDSDPRKPKSKEKEVVKKEEDREDKKEESKKKSKKEESKKSKDKEEKPEKKKDDDSELVADFIKDENPKKKFGFSLSFLKTKKKQEKPEEEKKS
jgi:cell division transport system ATP-binding protein